MRRQGFFGGAVLPMSDQVPSTGFAEGLSSGFASASLARPDLAELPHGQDKPDQKHHEYENRHHEMEFNAHWSFPAASSAASLK